jgi:hypothetical protein
MCDITGLKLPVTVINLRRLISSAFGRNWVILQKLCFNFLDYLDVVLKGVVPWQLVQVPWQELPQHQPHRRPGTILLDSEELFCVPIGRRSQAFFPIGQPRICLQLSVNCFLFIYFSIYWPVYKLLLPSDFPLVDA